MFNNAHSRIKAPFINKSLVLGLALIIATVIVFETTAWLQLSADGPGPLLLFAVVIAAALGGITSGLASSFLVIIYAAFYYSDPSGTFTYSADDQRALLELCVTAPAVALIVGSIFRKKYLSEMNEKGLRSEMAERERAERELRRSEERFRFLAENAEDVIYRLRLLPRTVFDYVSPSITKLTGYGPEDFYADSSLPQRLIHPDDQSMLKVLMLSPHTLSETITYRVITKEGNVNWVEQKNKAIYSRSGRLIAIEGIARSINKRKRAEEALRTSEERFRIAAECASEMIYEWDITTKTVKWFGKIDSVMGYNVGEFPRTIEAWESIIHPEDRDRVLQSLEAAVKKPDMRFEEEYRVRTSDGRVLYWRDRGTSVRNCSGQVYKMIGVISDISETFLKSRALQESESKFRLLSEIVPQIILSARPDGGIDHFNQAWVDYSGLTIEESTGWGWTNAIHPEDSPKFLERWRNLSGDILQTEIRIRRADCAFRWHLVRARAFKDSQGHIIKWFGTATDIEDQKRAEATHRLLALAGEKLTSSLDYGGTLKTVAELAVDYLGDICTIHTLDEHHTLRRVTQEKRPFIPLEGLGDRDWEYDLSVNVPNGPGRVCRTGQPEFVEHIDWANAFAHAQNENEIRIMNELRPKSYICLPLKARGHTIGTITFTSCTRHFSRADFQLATELTRRCALALDNARLYRAAQDANRMKDEFLAMLSHELRTPLNVILGWLELLDDSLDQDSIRQGFEAIRRNANIQAELINDLLDISRITSGKLEIDASWVDPTDLLKNAYESVQMMASARGVQIEIAADPFCPPIWGDAKRLQQVVWNLLTNAIKFSSPQSRVILRSVCDASEVRIEVQDFGAGIDPQFLDHVFERFQQEEGGNNRKHGGLGLGLAIVKTLAELHSGSVEARSAGKGHGATFIVRLPVREGARTAPQPLRLAKAPPSRSTDRLKSVRILLVDDSADSLAVIKRILEKNGASVLTATNVTDALDVLERQPCDVLLSDICMPGEDGYSFIKKVRKLDDGRCKAVPAAALTAFAREEERVEALASGFQRHISKPVRPAELISTVAELATPHQMPIEVSSSS